MRHAVALLLLACVAVAAPVPKVAKKRPDAEVFVGEWELTEGNNGNRRFTWTFDESMSMLSKAIGETGEGSKWTIRLTPDKSPKEIDFDSGGAKYQGLYEIDGDEIRIVYSNPRPANFDGKEKNNYTVLRRVEKK